MGRPAALVALALAPLALQGCATIFTGTYDVLTFDANVPGVRLSIDGRYQGELPLTVNVSRNFFGGRQFVARFERAGYQTQEFALSREFNTAAVLDITSPLTSGGIDVLTGSLMKLSPTVYHVQMLKAGSSARSSGFRREVELYRYVLVNSRELTKDVARGGGETLSSFAAAVCGGDREAAALVAEASLRNAPALLAASSPSDLARRLERMLGTTPSLGAHRL